MKGAPGGSRNMPILSTPNGKSPWELWELWWLAIHIGKSLLQLRYRRVSLKSKMRCEGNSHYLKEMKAIYGNFEHLHYH